MRVEHDKFVLHVRLSRPDRSRRRACVCASVSACETDAGIVRESVRKIARCAELETLTAEPFLERNDFTHSQ